MCSREGLAIAAGWILGLAAPAVAADPARLDLLAAEASRIAGASGPVQDGPALPGTLIALLAVATVAAFLGTYAGARRRLADGGNAGGGKEWRELTYRFRPGRPLRFKQDTLDRLNGLLRDLAEIGPDPKATGDAPPRKPSPEGPPPARPAPVTHPRPARNAAPEAEPGPSTPAGGDHRTTQDRARRLLELGHDPAAIEELTGIPVAELDLPEGAPAGAER